MKQKQGHHEGHEDQEGGKQEAWFVLVSNVRGLPLLLKRFLVLGSSFLVRGVALLYQFK